MHMRTRMPPVAALVAVLLCATLLLGRINANSDLGCTVWRVPPTADQLVPTDRSTVRKYFISADVTSWSYTPMGFDNCDNFQFPPGDPNFGNPTFRKAVFTQYMDGSFTTKRTRPRREEHLGILGPIIRAEEGDFIQVTLRNNLPFPINLEPSGVFYAQPQVAQPNTTVTYLWAAPLSTAACNAYGDASSQMWHYRSTLDPLAHNAAGLFGPIVLIKRGYMNRYTGRPFNIDRELFIVLQRFDESLAPVEIRDVAERLPDTHMPHSVNGISWCNLPRLRAAYGERVRWYVMGLGNEDDVHTAHWHGITVSKRSQRNVDSLFIVPGVAYTVDSIADNPGTWLFHCHVNHHLGFGMGALYTISGTPFQTAPGPAWGSRTRTYYIQSEIVEWDYAPSGGNLCEAPAGNGPATPFTPDQALYATPTKTTLGSKVLKAQYIEYTDATFTTPKPRSASEAHLGLQGPTIYAEVGDVIKVVFRNAIKDQNVSIHPHGVLYAKDSEGAPYNDGTNGALKNDDIVQYGATTTYRWFVPRRAGPGRRDPSSIMWMYHSHTDEAMDTWAGLFGSIIITRRGYARSDGTPADVDRHLVLTFSVLDEAASFLLPENAVKYLGQPPSLLDQVNAKRVPGLPFIPDGPAAQTSLVVEALFGSANAPGAEDFFEANKKHSINGYFFCNVPGLTAVVGQRTRVYLQAFGDIIDLHSPTFFSGTLIEDGAAVQAIKLLPGIMATTDLVPSAAGSWILQCSVEDHIAAGMRARLAITGGTNPATAAYLPVARTYYIASEKVTWDYAPLGKDGCSGLPFNEAQSTYTTEYIGSTYFKAQYIQYDGPSFKTPVEQPPQHGILGPVIAAEVGEVFEIVFKNTLPFAASLKFLSGLVPVGVEVNGQLQAGPDAALQLLNGGVAPGDTATFRWYVPLAAARGNTRHGLTGYTYLSGVDVTAHTHAGLIGLSLVGQNGRFSSQKPSKPLQVPNADFFYPLVFHIFDETLSPFLDDNILAKGLDLSIKDHDDFGEANLKHSTNGRLYCNLPALTMASGQKGIVVVAGTGTENGMHSPIFEGQALEEDGDGTLVPGLIPAVTRVTTLTAGSSSARWRAYCYVHDHFFAGMVIRLDTTGGPAAPIEAVVATSRTAAAAPVAPAPSNSTSNDTATATLGLTEPAGAAPTGTLPTQPDQVAAALTA